MKKKPNFKASNFKVYPNEVRATIILDDKRYNSISMGVKREPFNFPEYSIPSPLPFQDTLKIREELFEPIIIPMENIRLTLQQDPILDWWQTPNFNCNAVIKSEGELAIKLHELDADQKIFRSDLNEYFFINNRPEYWYRVFSSLCVDESLINHFYAALNFYNKNGEGRVNIWDAVSRYQRLSYLFVKENLSVLNINYLTDNSNLDRSDEKLNDFLAKISLLK